MPSCSLQYGLTAEAPEALDEEQATALMEAYGTDKGWVAKGPASTTRPPPLRAGRIVCELYDSEVGACVSSLLCFRPSSFDWCRVSSCPRCSLRHFGPLPEIKFVLGLKCQLVKCACPSKNGSAGD